MNIPELCIRRPVMTTLLMAALLVFGIVAYPRLPVNELPNVDFPTISISASLPGASPETMASAVATPLEAQLSTIAGIASMSSTSALGSTSITLTFDLNRNIDGAAQDVQSAISAAQRQLPREMPTPPTFRKVNPADAPILFLTMRSDTLPLSQVDEYAETELAQRLSMVDGVAQVNVYGAQKYAVRISVDPDKLAAAGIGIDQVQNAIADANVNQATGSLYGQRQQLPIRSDGQLMRAAAYNGVVVAWRDGAPVHVSDLGAARDSVQNDQSASWYNGERAVVLAISRQPGANLYLIADANGRILAGNVESLQPGILETEGWTEVPFRYERYGESGERSQTQDNATFPEARIDPRASHDAIALVLRLPNQMIILVGRDLGELLLACAENRLAALPAPRFSTDTALTVVMAAQGYPGTPKKGGRIGGIDAAEADGAKVFHAGTARGPDGALQANGGRVLNVTARGADVTAAQAAAYAAVDALDFPDGFCRRDIGWRELARSKAKV